MIFLQSIFVFGVISLVDCSPTVTHGANRQEQVQTADSSSEREGETAILVAASTTEQIQFACQEGETGVFADAQSCTLHYRCQQGRREVYKCVEGYLFNNETLRCEEQDNVNCTNEPNKSFASAQTAPSACWSHEDGLYANYSTSCQDYYRCVEGSVVSTHSCGAGLAFNFALQMCEHAVDGSCVESTCAADGCFTLPGSRCRAYYKCSRGRRTEHRCARGEAFSKEKQTCVANTRVCYEPVCTGRTNGRYADTTQQCQRSFHCVGGKLTSVSGCPSGEKFSGKSCLPASRVTCAEASLTAAPLQPPDHCERLDDGHHRASDAECRRYVACREGRTVAALRCPVGLRFDGQQCAPAESTMCPLDCSDLADGFHVDPASGCQRYARCEGGVGIETLTCAEGTVYNGRTCVPVSLYKCPSAAPRVEAACAAGANGYHTLYASRCREYVYCFNGRALFQRACTEGNVWDGKGCVPSDAFLCDGPEQWAGCLGLDTGLYQDRSPGSGCRKYYHCSEGNRTKLACPEGQLFDGKQCVPGTSYSCPAQDPDTCQDRENGYYQDTSSSCRSYFFCSNHQKITYVCSGSNVFDGKDCVDRSSYTCPFVSQDCLALPDGYHYDQHSGCRKYFFCMSGDKITTLTCAGGKVFDGRRCVERDAFNCPPATNMCASKADGVFADPDSGCRRYYKCLNQTQETVSICPDGKVFDGNECVAYRSTMTCALSQNLISVSDCSNSLNGFYQDKSSACRNYYFCIDGEKTDLSCPGNQLFDGQICVDASSYSCPSEKIVTNTLPVLAD